jgi:hypothetical protein
MNDLLQDRPWPRIYTTSGGRNVNIRIRWDPDSVIAGGRISYAQGGEEQIIREFNQRFPTLNAAVLHAQQLAEEWEQTQPCEEVLITQEQNGTWRWTRIDLIGVRVEQGFVRGGPKPVPVESGRGEFDCKEAAERSAELELCAPASKIKFVYR